MRRFTVLLTMALFFTCGAGLVRAQNGYDLFQKALLKERAEGNFQEAIHLYQRIAREFAGNRALAAKALVQMGQCYEKLGSAEARKAYERVLRDYADQPELARVARERLAAMSETNGRSSSGMVVRRVWDGVSPYLYWGPRVSLNGRYLPFVDPETFDPAVRDLVTGKSWRLTNRGRQSNLFAADAVPLVSPDGSQAAYGWGNLKIISEELHLIGLDGSGDRMLSSNSPPEPYLELDDWFPDGKQLLVTRVTDDGTKQLALVSVADGSVRVLKSFDWRYPYHGRFSPDGRYIVYSFPPKEDSMNRDLFVLAVDGSRETPLIEHPADDYALEWSPDGSRILFVSDRTGRFDLWSVSVRDGKPQGSPELVKQDIGPIQSLGFTQKGSLYFDNRVPSGMSDVYVAKLDPETGRLLASPKPAPQRFSGASDWPAWSPDGRYLAYIARRGPIQNPFWRNVSDAQVIVIRSVETGQERELTPKLNRYWQLRWSPDGLALVTKSASSWAAISPGSKGRNALLRIDAQTGEVTTMVSYETGQYPGRSFDWSPDGKAFFHSYGDSNAREGRLVRRDLETGQETVLYRWSSHELVIGFAPSRDGRSIALGVWDPATGSHALNVMPATGGEPRELVRFQDRQTEARFYRYDWTPDGRYLIYAKGNPQAELWRIAADGGKPQKLDLVVEGLRTLQMHPDGQRIVFSAGKTTEQHELWVMENFPPTLRPSR